MSEPVSPQPEGVVARARAIYKLSDKADDFVWARYFTRPYAALFLSLGHGIPWNPNLISILSLAVGMLGIAAFAFCPGYVGLWVAWCLGQLSYTLDCMDGMLARAKRMYSPAGIDLDFLGDAVKQVFIFSAVGYRLWVEAGYPVGLAEAWPLYAGLLGTPFVASALAMTTFMRSPAVTGKDDREHRPTRNGLMKLISLLMNYPSWILFPVIFDRMDIFLAISVPLYIVYCPYALLKIVRKVCLNAHYK